MKYIFLFFKLFFDPLYFRLFYFYKLLGCWLSNLFGWNSSWSNPTPKWTRSEMVNFGRVFENIENAEKCWIYHSQGNIWWYNWKSQFITSEYSRMETANDFYPTHVTGNDPGWPWMTLDDLEWPGMTSTLERIDERDCYPVWTRITISDSITRRRVRTTFWIIDDRFHFAMCPKHCYR